MSTYLETILSKIASKNPEHAAKLQKNNAHLNGAYFSMANDFFGKYNSYLERENKSLDYSVDCYLTMHQDMLEERISFVETGKYSSTSFDEVEKRVYANPQTMTYHMHGLVLAQFLWFEQFERISFFCNNLVQYAADATKYLEIGGGHGLYIYEAQKLLPHVKQFDLIDISQSSIDLAKGILHKSNINFYLKNIFDVAATEQYDFVTMGEVLEHVEDPLALLKRISALIGLSGKAFITTPVNAPMIDHIYLFNNEQEIRTLFNEAGLEIVEEKIVISEHVKPKMAEKFKVPVMYAAFVQNKN